MDWQIKKWSEVVDIISGKNQKTVANPAGKYPIYGSGGIMGYADSYLCDAGTTIVGRKGTINNPIFVPSRFWNVDTAFGISPKEMLVPKYLYYFCRYFNFSVLDKSTTIPSLAKRDLLAIEMPVPTTDEQERIVARIEELFSQLDNGAETLQKTKQQLAVYRQAVLKDAFEKCKDKEECQFGDALVEKPRNGYSPRGVDYQTKYRNLTLTATTSGYFKEECFKYIDVDIADDSYLWVKHNDILIQRANTIEYVGTAVLYQGENDKYVYPDLMIKCHAKDGVLPQFLVYQLQSIRCRKHFRKYATGTAGSMPKINQKTVMTAPIIMVPYEKQKRVVSSIESRLSVCDSIEKTVDTALQQAEAMRQSILKQAFEGRLG